MSNHDIPFNTYEEDSHSISTIFSDDHRSATYSTTNPGARMRNTTRMRCLMQCLPRFDKVVVPPSSKRGDGSFPLPQKQQHRTDVAEGHDDEENLLQAYMEALNFDLEHWSGGYDNKSCDGSSQDLNMNTSEDKDYFSLCPVVTDTTHDSNLMNHNLDEIEEYPHDSPIAEADDWVPFESLSFSTSKSKLGSKQHSPLFTTPPRTPSKHKRGYSHGTPGTEGTDETLVETVGTEDLAWDNFLVKVRSVGDLDLPCFESVEDPDDDNDDEDYNDGTNIRSNTMYQDNVGIEYGSNTSCDSDSDSNSDSNSDSDLSESDNDGTSSRISNSQGDHNCNIMTQQEEHDSPSDQNETKTGERLAKYLSIFYPNECSNEINSISFSDDEESEDDLSSCQEDNSYLQKIEDIGPRNRDFDTLYHSSMASI